jgi:hypothetical protein
MRSDLFQFAGYNLNREWAQKWLRPNPVVLPY